MVLWNFYSGIRMMIIKNVKDLVKQCYGRSGIYFGKFKKNRVSVLPPVGGRGGTTFYLIYLVPWDFRTWSC